MFSKSFPDVKSPEQMAFESKVEKLITAEEIDLDNMSVADYLMSDEDEQDEETMFEILEEMDFLGSETKKRKMTESEEQKVEIRKKKKTETEASEINQDEVDATNKQNISKEIMGMDKVDRKAVGAFFVSLKEMRKAAKLNLCSLTQIQELTRKYPCLDFIYKIMKPISEIMPENPINSIAPILQMSGVRAAMGEQKYETDNVIKIVPKWIVVDGRIKHKCLACEFEKVSLGVVNTHIMKEHVGQLYVCLKCSKILMSMDGLRRHLKNQHNE